MGEEENKNEQEQGVGNLPFPGPVSPWKSHFLSVDLFP